MQNLRLLLAVALVLMGAGVVLTAGWTRAPVTAAPVEGNFPVNAGATDSGDISAHNSPVVVRNPVDATNVVIANRLDSPRYSCALHVSTDAAQSFASSEIPLPEGEEPKCYAPDVVFGADGTLYLVFVTLKGIGNVPNAVWVSSSSDGGLTLSKPLPALGPLSFQVRIAADPDVPGRLYLTWLAASDVGIYSFSEPGNPIRFSVSEDGGSTWSDPVQVNDPRRLRVVAPVPAVGPDGAMNVAFLDLHDDRLDYHGAHEGQGGPPYPERWTLVLARSNDGGTTWSETVVDEVVPIDRIVVFIPPYPSMVIEPENGAILVAFHDARAGDSDVWLWRSTDHGATFSEGIRVNDTAEQDGTSQYLPALGVAPGGRLDVVYFDRRSDPNDILNEVSLQYSSDLAATFSERTRLSDRAFDSRIGFGSERGMPELGSRLGILSTDTEALAVWTDTRSGTQASAKQDLGRAVVRFTGGSDVPATASDALWVGGWVLIAIGLATSIFSFLAARPGKPGEHRDGLMPNEATGH